MYYNDEMKGETIHMDFFPYITEIQENHRAAAAAEREREARSRPGFLNLFEAQLEKRRAEKVAPQLAPTGAGLDSPHQHDFSMYKLFLSMLLRHGGDAPVVSPVSPDAHAVMRDTLSSWDAGSRAVDARDSDRFAYPRFPVVRFMKM